MTEPTPYSSVPQQPYGAPVGAPVARWNTLAIISIVASVIGIHLAGIITGHIALSQIKKTGEQGNILAIIGLILGYLGVVVVVILVILWFTLIFGAASAGFMN